MQLQPVDIKAMTPEIFRVFGTQNALLTAGDREVCNTMTIGWCQLGDIWHMPTCTVFVRPERYTYSLMESHDYFTVSVFDTSYRSMMTDCGRRSGRDVDKIKAHNLTICYGEGDAPYFAEADWVLVCKKLYIADMQLEHMLDERARRCYESGGLHRAYVGEVREAYQRQ